MNVTKHQRRMMHTLFEHSDDSKVLLLKYERVNFPESLSGFRKLTGSDYLGNKPLLPLRVT